MERFLLQLVPGIDAGWEGASQEEIAEIEAIAGRPLPNFYRWFLTRMGRDMGALSFVTVDFSAARVIACYREEIEEPDPPYLLIGYESDPVVPMHTWYDLDQPNRDDALVLSREIDGLLTQIGFETFRELLAWKAMLNFRIDMLPVRCEGQFTADGPDVRERIERAVALMGFEQPVSTGPFCGIFDRPDAGMTCRIGPRSSVDNVLFFRLAGADTGVIRRILGVIAKESDLKVEVEAWNR
ncbi:SMI1/KNR4 family protein [Nannocystis sp. SCPEA4]|uniref:SMI1/KNR4 family protein n=1 Tax=Nannocystis sp. SCPEA4 TaxID=2996787 RepID=UPI00226D91B9|nr:SMI1/KNR4 family protein [Nannocystis sp. SCPEA4]MCY1059890.1 SMI1/KNR4 family protein [Nannocystis sp. SCPEA4]